MKTFSSEQLADLRDHDDFVNERVLGKQLNWSGQTFNNFEFDRLNLNNANLSGCTFYDTNFKKVYALGANFSGAKFYRCNFNDCHFQNANFTNTELGNTRSENTIFSGVNLSESCIEYSHFNDNRFFGTNFTMATFYDVVFHSAILQEATMVKTNIASTIFTDCSFYDAVFAKMIHNREVKFHNCTGFPFIDGYEERLVKVAKLALKKPDSLAMSRWHTCDTSHCISGWGEHLEGEFGKFVVKQYGNAFGGLLLLGVDAFNHFFDTDSEGRAYLQSVLKEHEDKKRNATVPT